MKIQTAGWAGLLAVLFGLQQFSVYEHYREMDKLAEWRASATAQDTTYADGRFVYKVATVLDTTSEGDTILLPDVSALPGVNFWVERWKPNGDSVLLMSYDTSSSATAVDSATVDAIYTAWSLPPPAAYAMNVPGTPAAPPADPSIGDTSNAITYWFADWYSDSADLIADGPNGFYSATYTAAPEKATLTDTTSYGSLNKAVQYNYIYDTDYCGDTVGAQSGCEAITIATTLHNEIANKGSTDSLYNTLWWEYSFRLSEKALSCSYNESWGNDNLPHTVPTDTFDLTGYINYEGPCAWKFQEFNNTADDDWGRFMWILITASTSPNANDVLEHFWAREPTDSGQSALGAMPQNNVNSLLSSYAGMRTKLSTRVFDNQWHRVRFHIRESTPDSTYWNARFMMWFDDSLWIDTERDSVAMRTPDVGGFQRLRLGANKDHGGVYAHTEHAWWSHAILWTDTPSWFASGPSVGDTSNAISYWFADWYSDSADLIADGPNGYYSSTFSGVPWKASLVDSTSYANLSKAMQYNYIYDSYDCEDVEGSGCDAQTIGMALHNNIANKGATPDSMRELWWEYSFRLSADAYPCSYDSVWGAANLPYTTGQDADTTGYINYDTPCAWKFNELNYDSEGGNYGRQMWILMGAGVGPNSAGTHELHWAYGGGDGVGLPGDSGLRWINTAGAPPSNNVTADLDWDPGVKVKLVHQTFDNKWHRARFYVKHSTDLDTWDGRYAFWLDDSLYVDNVRDSFEIRTDTLGYMQRLRIGANKDHGGVFPHNEHAWWSHAIVWTDTPSWFPGGD